METFNAGKEDSGTEVLEETKGRKLGYHIDNGYPKKSFAKHIRRNWNKVEGRAILNWPGFKFKTCQYIGNNVCTLQNCP